MKDKSLGSILLYKEAIELSKDLDMTCYLPSFSTMGGLFDGWVHIWGFVRKDERGVIKEWHYLYTDAYNMFNFD